MNKFPSGLLLSFLESVELVVSGDIFAESSEHDHGHHASEEQHDHQAVHDGEVVDLVVGVSFQIHVPSVGPRQIRDFPLDIVREDDLPRGREGGES
jgi:hypothetical protein